MLGLVDRRDARDERSDSELEDEVIRLIRNHGLPLRRIHYNVVHDDQWIGEVDLRIRARE